MTKRTLNVGNITNELEDSKYFADRKKQKEQENDPTSVQVNRRTPEQVNKRTGEQAKNSISEKTVRKPFNIFEEHDAQIDWYIAEKKRAGKKSYNRSMFMRELLEKFFAREKRLGRMETFREKANG